MKLTSRKMRVNQAERLCGLKRRAVEITDKLHMASIDISYARGILNGKRVRDMFITIQ